jgi:exosortase
MATDTLPPEPAITPKAANGTSVPRTAAANSANSLANPPLSPVPVVWLGAAIGAVVVLAFAPLLQTHAQHLWERPHYQFFPLALLGSLALAWSYWKAFAAPLMPSGGVPTVAGLAVAWGLLAVAEIFLSPALAAIAFLVLCAMLIHGVGGIPLCRTLLPAWAFLWITVRPPFGLDNLLVTALQGLASGCSSAILDTLGVLHLPDGNVVEISGRRLFVEEACAGVNSLFSVLACALFLVLWLRRPLLRALVLIAASIGWVVVSNVVRIVVIAVVFDRWGTDLSVGLKHDLLGFACFVLAVVLIWSTDRLLLFVLPRAAAASPPPTSPVRPVPVMDALRGAAPLMSWPMAVAFGLLFLLHIATYGLAPADAAPVVLASVERLNRDSLPEQLAGWKQERFQTERRGTLNEYGEHSKIWIYNLEQRTASVSLDYPFPMFHVLDLCYINQGWAVERSRDVVGTIADGEPEFYTEVKLSKAGLRTGYLLYCECSQGGDFLEHEGNVLRSSWNRYEVAINSWRQRFARPEESESLKARRPAYQFQVFVEGNRPMRADEKDAVQQLFFHAVRGLRKEIYPAP